MMTRRGEVLTLVTSNRSKMPWESMSSSRSKVQAADNLEQVLTLVTSNRGKMSWKSMSRSRTNIARSALTKAKYKLRYTCRIARTEAETNCEDWYTGNRNRWNEGKQKVTLNNL